MSKDFNMNDFRNDGFVHTRIYEVIYKPEKKSFSVNVGFVDLKKGGALVDCTITITDWWDLEVVEKGSKVTHKYQLDEIPTDIDQIFKYTYEDNVLTLKVCGSLDIDSSIYYKFTKPKVQITGEYDPD